MLSSRILGHISGTKVRMFMPLNLFYSILHFICVLFAALFSHVLLGFIIPKTVKHSLKSKSKIKKKNGVTERSSKRINLKLRLLNQITSVVCFKLSHPIKAQ